MLPGSFTWMNNALIAIFVVKLLPTFLLGMKMEDTPMFINNQVIRKGLINVWKPLKDVQSKLSARMETDSWFDS